MNSIKNIKKEPMVVMNFTCPIGLRERLREHSIETKIGMATIIRKGIEEQITKNIPEKICEAEEWEELKKLDTDEEWEEFGKIETEAMIDRADIMTAHIK